MNMKTTVLIVASMMLTACGTSPWEGRWEGELSLCEYDGEPYVTTDGDQEWDEFEAELLMRRSEEDRTRVNFSWSVKNLLSFGEPIDNESVDFSEDDDGFSLETETWYDAGRFPDIQAITRWEMVYTGEEDAIGTVTMDLDQEGVRAELICEASLTRVGD